MNIVFFKTAISNSGGMERVSIVIANELAKNEDDKIFYVSRVAGVPFFSLSDKVELITLSNRSEENLYLNWFKYVWKVSRIVRKYKIDKWIDVGSNMSLISVPAKLLSHFELYTWEHFNLTYVWNNVTTPIARWLACHYAKKVVVLTQTDRKRFEDKYHTGNIVCIPNPVTISKVNKRISKEKIILAVGRLSYQKGYDMMLNIWKATICKDIGWRLVIIGGGELRQELKQQISDLNLSNSVSLIEPTKGIEEWYAKASLFIMTSRWEGLPLVLIEAISAGLPIISFDCETGPRDIVQDGYNGFLIKCFDLNDYARTIDLICEHHEMIERMSNNSRIKSAEFDIEEIMQEWSELIIQ